MTKPVITTRAGKGSALTWTEGDTNLTNLRDATITVSDGTTSTAIDLNGTITFTAGSGISVDESSGTITIANTQSAGITDVVNDTTPQLGGTLDANGNSIDMGTNVITDTKVGNWDTAYGWGNHSVAGYLTTETYTGTVTSVGGTGSVNGLSLSGTVTGSGNLTLGGTLDLSSPPAIGGSTPAAITASSLTATGTTTLATSLSGLLKASSGVVSAASAGTDYVAVGGALGTPSSGNLSNTTVDGTNAVGFKNLPAVGTKTTSYTLATTDKGKYVQVGSGGSITIPDATFAEGDCIVIANNHSAAITITCSITTAYIAGTDTDKASVSLATRGMANIFFLSGTACIITGNVS